MKVIISVNAGEALPIMDEDNHRMKQFTEDEAMHWCQENYVIDLESQEMDIY